MPVVKTFLFRLPQEMPGNQAITVLVIQHAMEHAVTAGKRPFLRRYFGNVPIDFSE